MLVYGLDLWICPNLNNNSVRNKFTDLQTIINGNVDIVSIAETKLDASFPSCSVYFKRISYSILSRHK